MRWILLLPCALWATTDSTLALAPLDTLGVQAAETERVVATLRDQISQSDQYALVEREKMPQILQEKSFQALGTCTHERCPALMELRGVDYLLAGTFSKDPAGYSLSTRLIRIADGVVSAQALSQGSQLNTLLGPNLALAGIKKTPPKSTHPTWGTWSLGLGVALLGGAAWQWHERNQAQTEYRQLGPGANFGSAKEKIDLAAQRGNWALLGSGLGLGAWGLSLAF